MSNRITHNTLGITPVEFDRRKYKALTANGGYPFVAECGQNIRGALLAGNCPHCSALRKKFDLEYSAIQLNQLPDDQILCLADHGDEYGYQNLLSIVFSKGHYKESFSTLFSQQPSLCGATIWAYFVPNYYADVGDLVKKHALFLKPMFDKLLALNPRKGVVRVSLNHGQRQIQEALVDNLGFKYTGEWINPNTNNTIRDLLYARPAAAYRANPNDVPKEKCIS